jgi:short-subunit dehydrogenase
LINVSSIFGEYCQPGTTVYCATKAFVLYLTAGIKYESRDEGLIPTSFQEED